VIVEKSIVFGAKDPILGEFWRLRAKLGNVTPCRSFNVKKDLILQVCHQL